MISISNKSKLDASLSWCRQGINIFNYFSDCIFRFLNVTRHWSCSVHTKHNVNNFGTSSFMVTIENMRTRMPCFSSAIFVFILVWTMTTHIITETSQVKGFTFNRRRPINRVPVWFTKPLIENFIFFRVELFERMLYILFMRMLQSKAILRAYTFFQMIMSSSFSWARLRTIFSLARLSGFEDFLMASFFYYLNRLFSLRRDEYIIFFVTMIFAFMPS